MSSRTKERPSPPERYLYVKSTGYKGFIGGEYKWTKGEDGAYHLQHPEGVEVLLTSDKRELLLEELTDEKEVCNAN